MRTSSKPRLIATVAAVALMSFLAAPLFAQNFPPGPADDNTTSLGSFRIYVMPQFQPLVTGCPGYNPGTFRWQSPTLYDPATVIGRSDIHLDGSPLDLAGTPVGTAGTIISDSNMLLRPVGFEGPPGTREVHTEVRALNMTGPMSIAVRAGVFAPLRPISPGEVESKTLGGTDFPAESFFDVYVEVDLPACGTFPGAIVYNSVPMLVKNANLTAFPPRVVYVHGNSTAVPVRFLNGNFPLWNPGDLFGYLVLAGHGISYNQGDIAEFESIYNDLPEMELPPPPPPIPSLSFYAVMILMLMLITAGVWMLQRRRRSLA